MSTDLAKVAEKKQIKYFLISFVDLFGVLRAKLVPARAIGEMQKEGARTVLFSCRGNRKLAGSQQICGWMGKRLKPVRG